MLSGILSVQDVIFAAFLAIFLTWFLGWMTRVIKFFTIKPTRLDFGTSPREYEAALHKCCFLFPSPTFIFNGTTINRGTKVRVVFTGDKTIEGQFVGTNDENMICFISPQFLVAHEITNIRDLEVI